MRRHHAIPIAVALLLLAAAVIVKALPSDGQTERADREDNGEAEERRIPPTQKVLVVGAGGWLFATSDLEVACERSIREDLVVERWGELIDAMRAGGKSAFAFVGPMKATLYPERLPAEYPYDDCAPAGQERLWGEIAERGPALGIVGLLDRLERFKQRVGIRLFPSDGQEWTTLGALTLVEAALDEIGDGVRVQSAEIRRRGIANLEIARDDGARRVPGRTLLLADAFGYPWARLFRPYFANLTVQPILRGPGEISARIGKADTVIVAVKETLFKSQAAAGEALPRILEELRSD